MIANIIIALIIALSTPAPVEEPTEEQPAYEYIGTYTISAYGYAEGENQTASGAEPKPYITIATSSKYPFGTVLYIEGVGECIVEDRGGYYIQSDQRIDLFIGWDDVNAWGLQQREVYIKK